jgi:hypothetical protein
VRGNIARTRHTEPEERFPNYGARPLAGEILVLWGGGKKKVKQSRYTPWRRLGGEEV